MENKMDRHRKTGVQSDVDNSTSKGTPPDPPEVPQPIDAIDQPRCLKDAAEALGVPYHVVQRAARRGLVPTYKLGTSRPYVKLRDFFDLMERSANR
jgi:hypothetical protein